MKAQILRGKWGESLVRIEDKGKVTVVPLAVWNSKLTTPIVPPWERTKNEQNHH